MSMATNGTFDATADPKPRRGWRMASLGAAVLLAVMALKAGFSDRDYYAVPLFGIGAVLAWWRTWTAGPLATVPTGMRVMLVIALFLAGVGLSFNGRAKIAADRARAQAVAEASDEPAVQLRTPKPAVALRLPDTIGCVTEEQLEAAAHAAATDDKRLMLRLFASDACVAVGGLAFTVLDVGLFISRVQVYRDGVYADLYMFSEFVPTPDE